MERYVGKVWTENYSGLCIQSVYVKSEMDESLFGLQIYFQNFVQQNAPI